MTPEAYKAQAEYFNKLGSLAASYSDCPCGCNISGQGIAQSCWSMASWLKHRSAIEEQKIEIMQSDAAARLKAARNDN
jgi:hypothetical protein